MMLRLPAPRGQRRAAATVELAILAPLLVFLIGVGADFTRLFFQAQVVANCARNGAIYGCTDPTHAADTNGIQSAALADASDLSPSPTISSTTGSDADGNYVEVTATFTFYTLMNVPGIPNASNVARKVRMRVSPVVPDF
jgi:Flp pilus assembly protein TadG